MKRNNRPPVRTGPAQKSVSLGRRIDLVIFGALLVLILLYRLQFVAPWITTLRVREVLYGYLYFRVLIFYRPPRTRLFWLVVLFLAYSMFVGLHTFFLYGAELAVKGFMRFVNVALLAPLAAVLITSQRQFLWFIKIWLAIVFLGAATGVYQFLGGDLSWLTQGYVVWRGETQRFMTLLGEPNVGGMASPIVLLLAFYVIRRFTWKMLTAILAFILMLLSVSKASLAGLMLAAIWMTLFPLLRKEKSSRMETRRLAWFTVAFGGLSAIFLLTLTIVNPGVMQKVKLYAQTQWIAFVGAGDPTQISPSFVDDLQDRLFEMTFNGLRLARSDSKNDVVGVIWGGSFGIAGTAAEEIRGNDVVITAHNAWSETYFVGGIIMLVLFLMIIAAVLRHLWLLSRRGSLFVGLLASFVICVAYLTIYPVMSNIVLGGFFWLVIGVAGNRWINREASLHARGRLRVPFRGG